VGQEGSRNNKEVEFIMRRVIPLTLVLALAFVAALAQGTPARSGTLLGGGCGTLSEPFVPWNDSSDYYFPANSGFENGTTGWNVSGGSSVVSGNETDYLGAATDSHSLNIPAGGGVSTTVCYGLFYPGFRFMVRGAGATVHVYVTTRNLLGILSTLDGGTFQAGAGWAPSPKVSTLFSALTAPLGAKDMQIHIDVSGAPAQIDDLAVDPFLMKD
jgi:hypothetical protein